MALRENEQRILAEIEHRLSADDPELAERFTSFGNEEFPFAEAEQEEESSAGGWKPWLVCGLITVMVLTLLVVLFSAAPTATEPPPPPPPTGTEQSVPDAGPAGP